MCGVFFFKQKTAYVVRSREWSSDACSSDLPRPCRPCPRNDRATAAGNGRQGASPKSYRAPRTGRVQLSSAGQIQPDSNRPSRDRQSAVYGKSVSVRVDLGCRSIIKKSRHVTKESEPQTNHHRTTIIL